LPVPSIDRRSTSKLEQHLFASRPASGPTKILDRVGFKVKSWTRKIFAGSALTSSQATGRDLEPCEPAASSVFASSTLISALAFGSAAPSSRSAGRGKPPAGTLYDYPPRHDVTAFLAGYPAPPGIGTQLATRAFPGIPRIAHRIGSCSASPEALEFRLGKFDRLLNRFALPRADGNHFADCAPGLIDGRMPLTPIISFMRTTSRRPVEPGEIM
jgi:hypothetical protein